MFLNLHELCIWQLDHPLNQSLACGKRWPSSTSKELLLNYNLIHLFVVSGAHALFFEKTLKFLGFNKSTQLFSLGLYVLCCNFSSPINRCFMERLLKNFLQKRYFHSPQMITKILSAFLCFPFSVLKGEITSLLLSLYFSLIVFCIDNSKKFELKIFLLSLPVYIWLLGLPPASSLIVLFFATPFIGTLLLPLSLLSLLSDSIEWLSHIFWWYFLDALNFLDVFFNYPKKGLTNFDNWPFIAIHLFILLSILHLGLSRWKRHFFYTY